MSRLAVEFHPSFKRSYKKRIATNHKLAIQTQKRIAMFQMNPLHPLLRNHQLSGSRRSYNAFFVTGDIRIIYKEVTSDHVIFVDIGSHNQIY